MGNLFDETHIVGIMEVEEKQNMHTMSRKLNPPHNSNVIVRMKHIVNYPNLSQRQISRLRLYKNNLHSQSKEFGLSIEFMHFQPLPLKETPQR